MRFRILSIPDGPLSVGIDGGIVRARNFGLTAVLYGNNVINVMRVRNIVLMDQTIFTISARSF